MTTPVVDVWMQHPTPRLLEQPFLESILRWTGQEAMPEVPLSMTLDAMDRGGVTFGLLSAWYAPGGPLVSNDEVADWVAASDGRLAGLAGVDLTRPAEAVAELRRCVEELGFRGLRMIPWLWELPPDHRLYYPLYVACIELGVPFCTQIGQTGPLKSSEPGRPIPYLERVALDFPDLTIVAGHVGAPWTDEAILLARKFPNVHLDSSAYKLARLPSAFVDYLRGSGRHKVLFASNHPMITAGACLAALDELGLDEEATELFLHENARRLFGAPPA